MSDRVARDSEDIELPTFALSTRMVLFRTQSLRFSRRFEHMAPKTTTAREMKSKGIPNYGIADCRQVSIDNKSHNRNPQQTPVDDGVNSTPSIACPRRNRVNKLHMLVFAGLLEDCVACKK